MMSLMFGESAGAADNGDGLARGPGALRHRADRLQRPAPRPRPGRAGPLRPARAERGAARGRRRRQGPAGRGSRPMRPSTSSLTGPIGPHRVWSWAKVSLGDVKQARSALGGTVNDVVLTLITNGYRALLEHRGEQITTDRVVRTMVPVSVRAPGERGEYNNRVSAVFARLPVGIDDPAERLGAIREQMDGIKSSEQAVAGDALAQLSGFAPPMLLALGSRVATRSARLNMDTATTNVPGPQVALAHARPQARRVVSLRPDRGHDPDRRRDLLLRRRALLRRDGRPGPRPGCRRAHRAASRPTSIGCSTARSSLRLATGARRVG